MAWGDAVIVAPESIEDIKTSPIGTGAFKFSNWVQGDKIDITEMMIIGEHRFECSNLQVYF